MSVPIRWRLTAAFAATLGVALIALGTFVLDRAKADAIGSIDTELRNRATATFAAGAVDAQLRRDLLGVSDENFGQELNATGSVIAASRQLGRRPIAPNRSELTDATVATHSEQRKVRLLVVTRHGRTLMLATALDDETDEQASLRRLLSFAGLLTFGVGTILAWLLAGAALRPVERLRRAADAYSSTDVSGRLVVPSSHDELRRLAQTLNAMLERIQDSFEQQRTFVDRASHELRTPLANLALELELALRGTRDIPALRSSLASAAEETARLDRLAANLLVFARANDEQPLVREPTVLDELVRTTCMTFSARAANTGVELVVDGHAPEPVAVDPIRVRQAISNLLDNALRASRTGDTVTVSIDEHETEAILRVHDTGTGFSAELRDNAFAPFVRGTDATGATGGAGLGLAIVAEVARAHGGRAWIEPDGPGTIVAVSFLRGFASPV